MSKTNDAYVYYITTELLAKHNITDFFYKIESHGSLAERVANLEKDCREYFGDEHITIEITDDIFHLTLAVTDHEGVTSFIPVNLLDHKLIPFKAIYHYFYEVTNEVYRLVVDAKPQTDGDAILKFFKAFEDNVLSCEMCKSIIKISDITIKEKTLIITYYVYTASEDKDYEKRIPIMKVGVECPLV